MDSRIFYFIRKSEMKRKIITTALSLVILLSIIKPSKSDCCGAHVICQRKKYCYDCTFPTPYCGLNRCNIFGCSCNCRQKTTTGWCRQRHSGCRIHPGFYEQLNAKNFLNSVDTDSDGKVSLTEAKEFIQRNIPTDAIIEEELIKLDTSNDGFLSFKEIDGY